VRARAWENPGLGEMALSLAAKAGFDAPQPVAMTRAGLTLAGTAGLETELALREGTLKVDGGLEAQDFSATQPGLGLEKLSGALPWSIEAVFGTAPDGLVLSRTLPVGGGVLSLVTAATDVRRRAAQPLFYERLRPYRERRGLSAVRITSGPYAIENFELDARLERGMLLADRFALRVLGGDVTGSIALQLGADGSVRGDFDVKSSNIDASNFEALNLAPGASSELSASAQLGFLFAPKRRDLTLNLNVTKIGAQTLDRFLQALDPEGKDKKLQEQRQQLWWFRTGLVRLDEVAAWVRYENLNVDLAATTLLRIPGTSVGYMPVPRELLRRYPLGEKLDVYLQPVIETQLAPLLGWDHAS